ncbi:hypothetical protein RJ639_047635 [Escallonia herrerae]|uniref:IBR domain-containing protein n=1 Tax=Escallonia herrerae TaxID=1293975 RepID=A0AA89B063_9ASTE|nr:hypothetical protein RJ639_047635 [Escallonia herrerae]
MQEVILTSLLNASSSAILRSPTLLSKLKKIRKVVAKPSGSMFYEIRLEKSLIPKDILVQWDESLCKSLVPESQKLYCPFRDCSAVLINDYGEGIEKIDCPECRRMFCMVCHFLLDSEFTCKEFQKLNAKKILWRISLPRRNNGGNVRSAKSMLKRLKIVSILLAGVFMNFATGVDHSTLHIIAVADQGPRVESGWHINLTYEEESIESGSANIIGNNIAC